MADNRTVYKVLGILSEILGFCLGALVLILPDPPQRFASAGVIFVLVGILLMTLANQQDGARTGMRNQPRR